MKQKAILLFGPTASGKTALAIELAKKFNGEIINADSRQVYKDMPIITAMPSADEFAAAPHHLFNFLDADADFSVGDYLKLAKEKADEVVSMGKMPIFVGGTGFYLKALEFGLAYIPNIEDELFKDLNSQETAILYNKLKNLDINMANKLESNDRQRIIRALGVVMQTSKSLLDWQQEPNVGMLDFDFIHLSINPDRAVMYNRINTRAKKMVDAGVINEVKNLKEKYQADRLNALTSIGFDIFLDSLNNNLNFDDACNKFAQKQRNYAKRQITWLNNQFKTDYEYDNLENTIEYVKNKL
jgi:tRNA dimethylallyltransferase